MMLDQTPVNLDLCNEERQNEREAIESIYGFDDSSVRLRVDKDNPDSLEIEVDAHFDQEIDIVVRTDFEKALTFKTRTLPPLSIRIDLPPDYPLRSPPIISELGKRTLWLSDEKIRRITDRLLQLYADGCNSQILFIWIEAMQQELLRSTSEYFILTDSTIDCNQLCHDALEAIHRFNSLASSSADEQDRIFEKSTNNCCNVCFSDNLFGRDCVLFRPCNHVSCLACARDFFRMHVTSGTIAQLGCMETDCDSPASERQIFIVLDDEEMYDRFERLSLERALDLMNDVAICPRPSCKLAVIVEIPRSTSVDQALVGQHVRARALVATCPHCSFSFCTFCRRSNHGISKCAMTSEEKDRLLDIYENGTDAERVELETQYGKHTFANLINEIKSMNWVREKSKPCPNCRTNIERSEGCNKMLCTNCRASFCWLCGKRITSKNPYDHFNNPKNKQCYSKLFENVEMGFDPYAEDEVPDFF